MAKFCKQYCLKYNPQAAWDYNLDTEFDRLDPGEMAGVDCDGYGFVAIGKEVNGTNFCVFEDDKDKFVRVPFVAIDDRTSLRVKGKL